MQPHRLDTVEVVETAADRPEFSDRGDSVVPDSSPTPETPRRSAVSSVKSLSDEELMVDAGVEPIFSTTEVAEFFDRSNQWLYWGLREGIFTDDDGNPLVPDRIGDRPRGRRRFTLPVIENIMRSSYRRGNIDPDHLKTIMRRIKYAQRGIEWREQEGWHYTHLERNRYRWLPPQDTVWDPKSKKWKETPEARARRKAKSGDSE